MAENNLRRGALRDRLHFQSRAMVDDGWGNQVPGDSFATQFTVAGNLRPLRGSEAVMADRLAGKQPFVLSVRYTDQTRGITTAWQAVDATNANRVLAITSPPADPDGKNQWLEMIVTEGTPS